MNRIEAGFGVVVGVIAVGAMTALASVAGAGGAREAEATVQTVAVAETTPQAGAAAGSGPNAEASAEAPISDGVEIWSTPAADAPPAPAGTPIDSAEAAIAVVRPLEGPGVDAGSERAVRVSADSVYGESGSLRASGQQVAAPPGLSPDDELWLVGYTGEIPAPFGVIELTLDHLVLTIDAATGRVLSSAGGEGGLPAVFDDAG
ncbi:MULTISPECIES: hypothetical protein [unclassified Rathayibacter]|uniref:hypothetical protein n=1 Tax=unclassified Rathayibacter TaxID=2609250 RepID=UPI00104D7BD8|nr:MULTISPECIES: hypothetical protein [unclassified Rathayibacter]TCL81750.1 hypothetical protein EDF49_107107 [Rathayibacter sp. PhB192]TCM26759.1 hypothetical protein EDF43_107107 [Rathayibacter sp. PhB179]